MVANIISWIGLVVLTAPWFQQPTQISRQFHQDFERSLQLRQEVADQIYDGYVQSRERIISVEETRSHVRVFTGEELQANISDVGKAASETLTTDQRRTDIALCEADRQYIQLMVELASVPDERADNLRAKAATAWRMQWVFDAQDLPYDRLPGLFNVANAAGTVSFPAPDSTAARYADALAPLLVELEHFVLFNRYEGSEQIRKVKQLFKDHDAALERELNSLVDQQFRADAIISQVRDINLRFWPEFERDLADADKPKFSMKVASKMFPYAPAVAGCLQSADGAMHRATNKEDREQVIAIMLQMESELRPLLNKADPLFIATHKSTLRRASYMEQMRHLFGLPPLTAKSSIEDTQAELQQQISKITSVANRAEENFEGLFR